MSPITRLIAGLQAPRIPIRKAAVVGAGAMGGAIAAQFANAGLPVVLLDIAADGEDRAAVARAGVAAQLKSGGFMHADAAGLVTPGALDDDLPLLADADWIVEAVVTPRSALWVGTRPPSARATARSVAMGGACWRRRWPTPPPPSPRSPTTRPTWIPP